jgi:hypothetical protein
MGTTELVRGNNRGSLELCNHIVQEINRSKPTSDFSELPLDYLESKYNEFQNAPDVVQSATQNSSNLAQRPRYL